jgi:ABC-type cobalamin/Fe3+-siderophores transport system ATPase subunit
MITLTDISCGYGNRVVLKDISFSLPEAKFTCLLGKNGVGKTTLFKTILGLLPVMKGEILYDGKHGSSFSAKDFAKYISYVPQAHGTPFPYSVLDVVLMGQYAHSRSLFEKPKSTNIEIALQCIQTLGIDKLTHKNFSKISGGEKQMVLIARAMAQQPLFIAMDEPTSNLDMGNQVRVMELTKLLTQNGYGVIMNTHSPQQAMQYADKVVLLNDGTVSDTGKPDEVLHAHTVSDLYNTPMEIVETFTSAGNKRRVLIAV